MNTDQMSWKRLRRTDIADMWSRATIWNDVRLPDFGNNFYHW